MLDSIGDFRILKSISKGALGDVYLAEHKFLKKKFAIKLLPKELSEDSQFIQSFEEEVSKIAALEHLNIVKTHTVSKDGDTYFLVNDFISNEVSESCNLSQFLSGLKNRLSEKEILSILKQVAYALDYIHKNNLFHGSLKLNNILVGKNEEGIPHLYLSDATISSIIGQGVILTKMYQVVAHTLGVDQTITGLEAERPYMEKRGDLKEISKLHRSFLQSYAFLAPEQKLGGAAQNVSMKSDIFSFGLLAYFLLMGYMPEGYFKMPLSELSGFNLDWDLLIRSTLKQNPNERVDNLVDLLEKISLKELGDIEKNLKRVTPVKQIDPSSDFLPSSQVAQKRNDTYKDNSIEKPSYEPKVRDLYSKSEESVFPQYKQMHGSQTVRQYVPAESTLVKEEEEIKIEDTPQLKPIIQPSVLKKFEYEEDPGAIFETKLTVTQYKPQQKEVLDSEPMLTEMCIIEGGNYFRGANAGARDEKPRHPIELSSFAIDIHPVTNEQFVRFLDVMGCEKDCNNQDMINLKESRIKRSGGKLSIESGYAKHPVVGVSWYGARAYAHWVGKRLPTEAEWEIAASSGLEENIYPTGVEIERSQANFFSSDTTPVMSYPANQNGLFDVVGNVYEWVEDWYGYNYYEISVQEPFNPKGPLQGVYRVLRGGCWKSLKDDLRCAHRHRNNPGSLNRTYGFRCAADVG
jgi:formylglycine-generating enzyme required for sulfatase activity/tRNA A-37 threonylcarbamoyl transferase component Bud32